MGTVNGIGPYGLWIETLKTVNEDGHHETGVGKGSRQNRSVISGKGLALRVGYRGPWIDVRAEQKLLDAFWWIVDSRMARIAVQGTPLGAFPVQ